MVSSNPDSGITWSKRWRPSNHLLDLINTVLDLSKVEAGELEPEQARSSLGGVLDHVTSIAAVKANQTGVAVRVEAEPDGPHALSSGTRCGSARY